ncbi:hypothetical protein BGW41_005938 [Actinomortierella wolfii]|nr:hypothetical protein BGW41_005938 [Actinomortierella wolfii]
MGSKGKRKNSKKTTASQSKAPVAVPAAAASAAPEVVTEAPPAYTPTPAPTTNFTSSPSTSSAPSAAGSAPSSPKPSQAKLPSTPTSVAQVATTPSSSTPLNKTTTQNYGTSNDTTIKSVPHTHSHSSPHSHSHGGNDGSSSSSSSVTQEGSPVLRPATPPPIACKGVLITNESAKNKKKLIFVTCLCLCFFALELVGGYFAQSLALISDAFHLLSDVVSFMVSLAAIWLAEQPATKRHSFGYHRAEVLAALISVFIIWILTAFLLLEAVERIRNPVPIDGKTMATVAAIGVDWRLHLDTVMTMTTATATAMVTDIATEAAKDTPMPMKNVSHSSMTMVITTLMKAAAIPTMITPPLRTRRWAYDYQIISRAMEVNINIKAATLHVIGDLISSVGVLIASVIIIFKPTWTYVDPVCTIFFSILVMFTTYRLVWDSLGILMEGTPTHIDPEEVEAALMLIDGVAVVHDLHVWNLTVGKPALAVHLQLKPRNPITEEELTMNDYERILTEAQNTVCGRFQIHHSTIQLETHSTTPSEHCRPGMCQDTISNALRGIDVV